MKHLGRYLKKYPKEVWHFDYQEQPDEAVVLTDSDWGACKRTRKSMSSYAERFGKHLIDSSCAKQSVIALSSGEAEFYALVRGAAAGLLTVQIWERVGFKGTKLTMKTDSSAAKGIATRKGSGKVKHLSMKELWIQDCVQKNQLRVQKEPTKTNWADLGTKALSGSRVSELVKGMPLTRGLVMACLFASFGVATGQPKEDKLENVDLAFFAYMLIIHILAIQSICSGSDPHVLGAGDLAQQRRWPIFRAAQTDKTLVKTYKSTPPVRARSFTRDTVDTWAKVMSTHGSGLMPLIVVSLLVQTAIRNACRLSSSRSQLAMEGCQDV